MRAQILVVDDEPDISALVAYHLARASYQVRTATDGVEAVRAVETQAPDLILLDLMLPGISGLEILKELRRRPETRGVPIILLTARREERDRIQGLELGADDYVAKPFSPQELILRVGAVLRRSAPVTGSEPRGGVIRYGPFVIDPGAVRAEVDGRPLDLTPTEFKLLQVLVDRRGRVQSRAKLLESVWEVTANISTRTVDMHVQRLRAKLGGAGEWVETVRGFGYRFRGEV